MPKPVYFEENVTISQGGQPFLYRVKYDFLDWRANSAAAGGDLQRERLHVAGGAAAARRRGARADDADIYVESRPPTSRWRTRTWRTRWATHSGTLASEGLAKGYMRVRVGDPLVGRVGAALGPVRELPGLGRRARAAGDEHFWVGHEAALGVGYPTAGQCVANPLIGEVVAADRREVRRRRDAGRRHGARGSPPTSRRSTRRAGSTTTTSLRRRAPPNRVRRREAAAAIFEAGFASEDVAKGGCPLVAGAGETVEHLQRRGKELV